MDTADLDLGYVDRKEIKVTSPDREHLRPSGEHLETGFNFPNVQNGAEDTTDSQSKAKEDGSQTGGPLNGTGDANSGCGDNADDGDSERFTDRLEKKIAIPDLEDVVPTKFVDQLFQFVDDEEDKNFGVARDGSSKDSKDDVVGNGAPEKEEIVTNIDPLVIEQSSTSSVNSQIPEVDVTMTTQTLDDVNNNNDQGYEQPSGFDNNNSSGAPTVLVTDLPDLDSGKGPDTENIADFSLTVVEDKAKLVEEKVELVEDDPGLNLYWYSSTTMELDPLEIEQVKNGRSSSPEVPEIQVSSIMVSKTTEKKEDTAEPTKVKVTQMTEDITLQAMPKKEEKWSSAYDSASSRFLDLASEIQKTTPNDHQTIQAAQIESKSKVDPWGLESESKTYTSSSSETKEMRQDLPSLDVGHLPMDLPMMQMESTIVPSSSEAAYSSAPSYTLQETEDLVDTKMVCPVPDLDNTFVSSKERLVDVSESMIQDEDKDEDEADAIGMMLLSDRPPKTETEDSQRQISVKGEEKIIEMSEQIVTDAVKQAEVMYVEGQKKVTDVPEGLDEVEGKQKSEWEERQVAQEEIVLESSNRAVSSELSQLQQTTGPVALKKTEQVGMGVLPDKERRILSEPVPIQRKYIMNADSEAQLTKVDGKLQNEVTFTDVYYDDDSYTLTLRDCWLRQRNGAWEMKGYSSSSPSSSSASCYLDSVKDIQNSLIKMCGDSNLPQQLVGQSMSELKTSLGLVEFTSFLTTRKTYTVDGAMVIMDLTDFGFQTAQLEMTAENVYSVPATLYNMEKLAKRIGLNPLQCS